MELPAPLVEDVLGWLPGRLRGAAVLVRGADCPQGAAVVRALVGRGLLVAAWGSDRTRLGELETDATCGDLLVLRGSARPDVHETNQALARANAELGPVRLFIDAADGRPGSDPDDFARSLEVLVAATATVSRTVATAMAADKGGTICVLAGLHGYGDAAAATAWNAIQAARAAMARSLRRELADAGVGVALVQRAGCFGLDLGDTWTAAAVAVALETGLDEVAWPVGAGLCLALSQRLPWPLSQWLDLAASRPLPAQEAIVDGEEAAAASGRSRKSRASARRVAPATSTTAEAKAPRLWPAQASGTDTSTSNTPPHETSETEASADDSSTDDSGARGPDADETPSEDGLGSNAAAVRDLAARAAAAGQMLRKPRPGRN